MEKLIEEFDEIRLCDREKLRKETNIAKRRPEAITRDVFHIKEETKGNFLIFGYNEYNGVRSKLPFLPETLSILKINEYEKFCERVDVENMLNLEIVSNLKYLTSHLIESGEIRRKTAQRIDAKKDQDIKVESADGKVCVFFAGEHERNLFVRIDEVITNSNSQKENNYELTKTSYK